MNVIKSHQERRNQILGVIKRSIKKVRENEDVILDMDKLTMQVCSQFSITFRTAKDYIKIALYQLDHKELDLE